MKFRNPVFRSTNGRLYLRPLKYEAPVFWAPEGSSRSLVRFIADANIITNSILPRWLLRRLDARPGAKTYWHKVRQQEQRLRPEENFND